MRVVVIGSEGFIGQALVAALRAGAPLGAAGERASLITRLDLRMAGAMAGAAQAAGAEVPSGPGTAGTLTLVAQRCVEGDICDRAVLARAFEGGVECVFHLASIPGGAAEQNFELGLRINLQATIDVLEALRATGSAPKLVFASTIGVYGVPMPPLIDEQTVPEPALSYGAHKYIGEVLIADYGRRGFVDGRAVRIPGIVARPPTTGMLSLFLSNVIRDLAAGRSFLCPVAPDAPSWWMSRPCIVENLLHAARLPAAVVASQRVFLLPVLRLTCLLYTSDAADE